MPLVLDGKVISGTKPYATPENIKAAIKALEPNGATTKSSTSTKDSTSKPAKPPVPAPTPPKSDKTPTPSETPTPDRTFSSILAQLRAPLVQQVGAADSDKVSEGERLYKIVSGNSVTVVAGDDVTSAAAKVGTHPLDPDVSITSVGYGCYPMTYQEAKDKYERNPTYDFGGWTPEDKTTIKDAPSDAVVEDAEKVTADLKPEPYIPVTITKYQFTLNNGKTRTFEAMTPEDAEHAVSKWDADINTLQIIGTRAVGQHEIKEALRSAASRSDMDYARAVVKYGQAEGFVPVRDGKTRDAMLIAAADWDALSDKQQKIVLSDGIEGLNKSIYNSLPDHYQTIADKEGLDQAISVFNGDVQAANEVIDKLKPYKDGDSYDIVTPLELGVVTGDELRVAGFGDRDVKAVEDYVDKLTTQLGKWETYAAALKDAIAKHGDKEPNAAALEIHNATRGILTNAEKHDFFNAITESGAIKKYGLGGTFAELQSLPDLKPLAEKWKAGDISLEDKYNIAEIYATYPAPGKLLPAGYRGMLAEAPEMNAAARFGKQFALGGAAAVLNPFVKDQVKSHLETILKDYKDGDGYNIAKYLRDYPEDASILARGGVKIDDIEKAQDGTRTIVTLKGATSKDWAVAGLIVTAIGAGGASMAAPQPAASGLLAVSGLSTLALGTYATIDTVRYWPQMDNTQRAIAVSFDVLLFTSGALGAKAGLRGFKQHGGWLMVRNRLKSAYNSARYTIKKILPNTKKVDAILADLDRAMRTGDRKLLVAAARRLELEAGKVPKQLGESLQTKAKLLQAAPDDYLKLKQAPKDAPDDLVTSIRNMDAQIKAYESALRRVKRADRYNSIRTLLDKTVRDRQRLLTQVKTKERTTVSPFERVIWDRQTGKYLPATKTTALTTKAKPPPVKAKPPTPKFKLLQLGQKVRDLLRKKRPSKKALALAALAGGVRPKPARGFPSPDEVSKRLGVSIWDISRATRKLPKGVQEEIALYSPEWAIIIKTKGATITATQTALRNNLARLQQQQAQTEPELKPLPMTAPLTQTAVATKTKLATKTKAKTKLSKERALQIYPFFDIPQKVKTRYKRRRPRLGGPDFEDISERLPPDRKGIITRKQGIFYVTIFPPYDKQSRIFTRKKPFYAESGRGKGSPQRTLKTVGGKVPKLVQMPMGVVTTHITGGEVIKFTPRSGPRRRRKGRRRGRLVYA